MSTSLLDSLVSTYSLLLCSSLQSIGSRIRALEKENLVQVEKVRFLLSDFA